MLLWQLYFCNFIVMIAHMRIIQFVHLVLPLNNVLSLAKLKHVTKPHRKVCKKSETNKHSLSRHIGSRKETGDRFCNCPSQASAIDAHLVEISNGGVVNNLPLDDLGFNRPIAWSCRITMLGNYYFAIVGHYDNPVFEMEFNPPMKTMDSSQSRDQSYKVLLRLGNQKSISTDFLRSHLPPLRFSVIRKDISRQDTHSFVRAALFNLR